jgi:arsenite oxidase small subunit
MGPMRRRTLLFRLSALFWIGSGPLSGWGCSRRREGKPRDLPLLEPVVVPLSKLERPWKPVQFKARLSIPAPKGDRLVIIPGVLLRVGPGAAKGEPGAIRAYSLLCPHEYCPVNLVEDPRMIRLDSGRPPPEHPLLFCPCHFSVFDPEENGLRLSGPAERGAYRFSFREEGGSAVIEAVESGVTRLFGR